ncbi:hypothetical protein ABZ446_28525 [Streptomyces sp. NPDC005813]|uniref:hypothetical protein n=1 Tax=Streptomyces sp. NPDC005813 TaxID=3155592 RepID=UPI0033FE46A2
MAESCGEPYDSSDEYSRDDRIETIYQGWGAREMAERIVDLEDELGADVEGMCTGMHADVAEAHAEIERLASLVGYWEHRAEEAQRDFVSCEAVGMEWMRMSRRYRSAWLSARRRAADEANLGQEAVDHIRHDRDRWRRENELLCALLDELRKTTYGAQAPTTG